VLAESARWEAFSGEGLLFCRHFLLGVNMAILFLLLLAFVIVMFGIDVFRKY